MSAHQDLISAVEADVDPQGLLNALDWDFGDAQTGHTGHSIHPYPAKFPPQLPAQLIELLTSPGDLVVDCFGGSGTTALEALRLGRRAGSIDANPVGSLVAAVKLTEHSPATLDSLRSVADDLAILESDPIGTAARGANCWQPPIPNVERWYPEPVLHELAAVRDVLSLIEDGDARAVAMVAFANVAARVSNQESETRYVSVDRQVSAGSPTKRVRQSVLELIGALESRELQEFDGTVVTGDARSADAWPFEPGTVDAVITSPPYPNAYDYHLYHRFRIFWLGEDPAGLRSVEIGSHLKFQADADPILSYETDMLAVLEQVSTALRPGRSAAFVVGDGVVRGVTYKTADELERLAATVGLMSVGRVERVLPANKRSVTSAGRRLRTEAVCIFRLIPADPDAWVAPTYATFPYEEDLGRRERALLGGTERGSGRRDPRQAAFAHAVGVSGAMRPTYQRVVESGLERSPTSKAKNSTYAGHGLHRYKGKFYPQLAKALLNIGDPYDRPGLVCDPFGGSGTVAVEAVLAGLDVLSMDVNPLAVAVARAKVGGLGLPHHVLLGANERLTVMLDRMGSAPRVDWNQFGEATRDELESWFAPAVLRRLSTVLAAVRSDGVARAPHRESIRLLYEALVSDLIREVSHQEPSDLRIRRRTTPLADAPVRPLFEDRLNSYTEDHRLLQSRLSLGPELGRATFVLGSSAEAGSFDDVLGGGERRISAVVSSPPYGTALPYLDTDRLSLAAVYGWDRDRRRLLEDRLIGSREITNRDRCVWEDKIEHLADDVLPWSTVTFLGSLLSAVQADPSAGFRKQQAPAVLCRYFTGMSRVLANLASWMEPGAEASFVVGDSRTTVGDAAWTVPTVQEVKAIAKLRGLDVIEVIPITVTREAMRHAKNAITENQVIRLAAPPA